MICGNHDITCDKDYYNGTAKNGQASWKRFHHNGKNDDVAARRALRETKNLIYLEDESIVIDGYSFYGSPWQPEFCDWAFNLDRGYPCKMMWEKIPTATDILITHGPPVGHGDMVSQQQRAGCVDLLSAVTERIRPLYHVFGHVHEGYGVTTNQTTTFINASTCTLSYRPNNAPIVFDLPRKNLNTIPSTKMESNNSGIIKIDGDPTLSSCRPTFQPNTAVILCFTLQRQRISPFFYRVCMESPNKPVFVPVEYLNKNTSTKISKFIRYTPVLHAPPWELKGVDSY